MSPPHNSKQKTPNKQTKNQKHLKYKTKNNVSPPKKSTKNPQTNKKEKQ